MLIRVWLGDGWVGLSAVQMSSSFASVMMNSGSAVSRTIPIISGNRILRRYWFFSLLPPNEIVHLDLGMWRCYQTNTCRADAAAWLPYPGYFSCGLAIVGTLLPYRKCPRNAMTLMNSLHQWLPCQIYGFFSRKILIKLPANIISI